MTRKTSKVPFFGLIFIICWRSAPARTLEVIRLFDSKNKVRVFRPHPQLQVTAKNWTYTDDSHLEVSGDVVIFDQRSRRRYKAAKAQLQTSGLVIERQLDAGDLFPEGAAHTVLSRALQTDEITRKWRVNWYVQVGSLSCGGTSTYDRAQGIVENSSSCTEMDSPKPQTEFQRYTGVTDAMIAAAARKIPVAGSTEAGFENLIAEGATLQTRSHVRPSTRH